MFTARGLYIDGNWHRVANDRSEAVINPATEAVVGEAPVGNARDAEAAIGAARRAFDASDWAIRPMVDRAEVIERFVDAVEARGAEIKAMITSEAGSVQWLTESLQFATPIEHARYAIAEARGWRPVALAPEVSPNFYDPDGPGTLGTGVVLHDPVGVVAAITPYNFPFFLNLGKIVPALLMGNTLVLKPSPLTPFVALILGEIADEIGIPKGVLNIVTGGADVGTVLTSDARIDMVSFTGSDAVGAAIMAQGAPTLKRVLLELGGKSAMIVRADADLASAVADGLANFTLHSGQGCALQTRHLVHNRIRAAYVEALAEAARSLVIGNPADPATMFGPLIGAAQRDRVEHYVEHGRASSARLVGGGRRPASQVRGFFYEPTIFDDVDNSSAIAQDEIFGPVACVIGFDTDDEAVAIANDSKFGLSGGIHSADVGRAYSMAGRLRTGDVSINGGAGKMLSHAPFGGIKRSGLGREYGSGWLHEYAQSKTVLFHAG